MKGLSAKMTRIIMNRMVYAIRSVKRHTPRTELNALKTARDLFLESVCIVKNQKDISVTSISNSIKTKRYNRSTYTNSLNLVSTASVGGSLIA